MLYKVALLKRFLRKHSKLHHLDVIKALYVKLILSSFLRDEVQYNGVYSVTQGCAWFYLSPQYWCLRGVADGVTKNVGQLD